MKGVDLLQPDLRAHEGPYSPTSEVGKVRSRPVRLAGPPLQPDRAGARRRGQLRGPHASTPTVSTWPRRCGPRRRTRAPPSSRSTRTATSSTTARSTPSAEGQRERTRSGLSTASRSASAPTVSAAWPAARRRLDIVDVSRGAPTGCSCTTPAEPTRASPSRSPTYWSGPPAPPRSECFARCERPLYGEAMAGELEAAQGKAGPGGPREAAALRRHLDRGVNRSTVLPSAPYRCLSRTVDEARASAAAAARGAAALRRG